MPDIVSQIVGSRMQQRHNEKLQKSQQDFEQWKFLVGEYLKGTITQEKQPNLMPAVKDAYQGMLKEFKGTEHEPSFRMMGMEKGLEDKPEAPPAPKQPMMQAPPVIPDTSEGMAFGPHPSLPAPPRQAPAQQAPQTPAAMIKMGGNKSGEGYGGPSPSAPLLPPGWERTPDSELEARTTSALRGQLQARSGADLKAGQDRWQAFISNPENAVEYAKAEPNIKMALRAEVMFPQTNLGSMAMGGAVNMPGTIAGDDPSIQQFSPDPTKNYHATRDRAGNIIGIFAASYAPMYRMGKPVRDEVSGEWTYPMVSSRTGQMANSVGMAPPTGTWTRTSTGQKEQIIEMEDPDNPGQLIKAKVVLGSTTTSVPKPTAAPSGTPTRVGLPAPPSSPAAPIPMGKAPSQVRRGQENPLTAGAQNIIIQSKPTAELVRQAQQYIKLQGWDKDPTPMTTFLPRLSYAMGFGTDQGAFLGALNMDQIISAGSVLRTSGGVRAVQSLNMAMVHTPDAWKDSGKLMYDKLGAIADRLDIIQKVAREEGQRYPGLKRDGQSAPKEDSDLSVPPGRIKAKRLSDGAIVAIKESAFNDKEYEKVP